MLKELHEGQNPTGIRTEIDMIFLKLPFFMPWVWELFVLLAVIGFIFGMGAGAWADMSLRK
jgi:hypothetical protein